MGAVWLVSALIIAIGLVGIAVPVLPGLVVVFLGVLLWGSEHGSAGGWVVVGLSAVLMVAGYLCEYLIPGRRMRSAGVGTTTILAGAALGVVGFFVIPVVGLFLGFVLGVYLSEAARPGRGQHAWAATRQAVRAVLTSIGVELTAGLAITLTWIVGLSLT